MFKYCKDYPWSSYRSYAGYTRPPEWMETNWLLSLFSANLKKGKKWLKLDPDEKVEDISKEMDADAVPDAMTFYPSIYRLHIILMVSTLLIAIVVSIYNLSIVNVLCTIGAAVVLYYFRPYTQKYDPEWARSLSERNRIIWKYVFEYMVREKRK
jgi:hypothetical protein